MALQDASIRDLSDVRLGMCPCCGTVRGGEPLGEAWDALPEALRVNSAHMVPPFAVHLCGERHVLEGEGPVRLVLMSGCRAAELLRAGCHKRDFLRTVKSLSQTMVGEPFQAVAMRNPKELGFPERWGGGSDDGGSDDSGTGGEIVAAGSNGGRESELPEGEAGAVHLPGYAAGYEAGYAAGVREGFRAGVGAGEKKALEEIQKHFNEVGTMVAANESTGRAYAALRLLLAQEQNLEVQAAPEAPPARNRVPDDWAEKLGANSAGMDCEAVMLEVLMNFGGTVEVITEKKRWQQVGKELLTRGGWTALAQGNMAGHIAKQAFEQHFNYHGLVQHRERRRRRRVVLNGRVPIPGTSETAGGDMPMPILPVPTKAREGVAAMLAYIHSDLQVIRCGGEEVKVLVVQPLAVLKDLVKMGFNEDLPAFVVEPLTPENKRALERNSFQRLFGFRNANVVGKVRVPVTTWADGAATGRRYHYAESFEICEQAMGWDTPDARVRSDLSRPFPYLIVPDKETVELLAALGPTRGAAHDAMFRSKPTERLVEIGVGADGKVQFVLLELVHVAIKGDRANRAKLYGNDAATQTSEADGPCAACTCPGTLKGELDLRPRTEGGPHPFPLLSKAFANKVLAARSVFMAQLLGHRVTFNTDTAVCELPSFFGNLDLNEALNDPAFDRCCVTGTDPLHLATLAKLPKNLLHTLGKNPARYREVCNQLIGRRRSDTSLYDVHSGGGTLTEHLMLLVLLVFVGLESDPHFGLGEDAEAPPFLGHCADGRQATGGCFGLHGLPGYEDLARLAQEARALMLADLLPPKKKKQRGDRGQAQAIDPHYWLRRRAITMLQAVASVLLTAYYASAAVDEAEYYRALLRVPAHSLQASAIAKELNEYTVSVGKEERCVPFSLYWHDAFCCIRGVFYHLLQFGGLQMFGCHKNERLFLELQQPLATYASTAEDGLQRAVMNFAAKREVKRQTLNQAGLEQHAGRGRGHSRLHCLYLLLQQPDVCVTNLNQEDREAPQPRRAGTLFMPIRTTRRNTALQAPELLPEVEMFLQERVTQPRGPDEPGFAFGRDQLVSVESWGLHFRCGSGSNPLAAGIRRPDAGSPRAGAAHLEEECAQAEALGIDPKVAFLRELSPAERPAGFHAHRGVTALPKAGPVLEDLGRRAGVSTIGEATELTDEQISAAAETIAGPASSSDTPTKAQKRTAAVDKTQKQLKKLRSLAKSYYSTMVSKLKELPASFGEFRDSMVEKLWKMSGKVPRGAPSSPRAVSRHLGPRRP